jgi:hypothetical protein
MRASRAAQAGALVSDIVIDATEVATDTIHYVATDPPGLTSTSTRTVIIEPTTPHLSPSANNARNRLLRYLCQDFRSFIRQRGQRYRERTCPNSQFGEPLLHR